LDIEDSIALQTSLMWELLDDYASKEHGDEVVSNSNGVQGSWMNVINLDDSQLNQGS
jgi:hypothetical protein